MLIRLLICCVNDVHQILAPLSGRLATRFVSSYWFYFCLFVSVCVSIVLSICSCFILFICLSMSNSVRILVHLSVHPVCVSLSSLKSCSCLFCFCFSLSTVYSSACLFFCCEYLSILLSALFLVSDIPLLLSILVTLFSFTILLIMFDSACVYVRA